MSDDFGVVLGANAVRFESILAGPIERVWAHLTQSELLALWFAPGAIAPRQGGAVVIRFDRDDAGEASAGIVTCWDPPRRLAYRWDREQSEVTFELAPHGDQVRLVLTEVKIAPANLTEIAGGWHAYANALRALLAGTDPAPLKASWRTWPGRYQRRLAQD